MKTFKALLRDILLSLVIGFGIGLGLLLVTGGIGAAANGLEGALEASRGTVLVVGGLLMIYSALLLLKGGNLPQDAFTLWPGKKRRLEELDDVEPLKIFRKLPRYASFFLMSVGILATSLIPESVVLYYL